MSTASWKGPVLPEAGDDLLSAWHTFTDTAGIITTATSIAAARVILTAAEAGGASITTGAPAYFNIGGIVYMADGSKTGSVWVLKPVNETERTNDTYGAGGSVTLIENQASYIINSPLPARPYDRFILAFGQAWGNVTAGRVNLVTQIAGVQGSRAAFDTSGAETQSSMNLMPVPAGTDPLVRLAVLGGTGGGTISLSNNPLTTRLSVVAFPITMA